MARPSPATQNQLVPPGTSAGGDALGQAQREGQRVKDALGNYAAAKRSERLTTVEEAAEGQSKTTHSGLNTDNKIRQAAFWIVDPRHPERRFGYSPKEIAAITDVAEGTATRNTIRWAGNFLGGGGGLGALVGGLGTGFVAAGPGGAGLGAVGGTAAIAAGLGLRKAGEAGTKRSLRRADTMIRQRSPLAGQNIPSGVSSGNDVLIRALITALQSDGRPRRAAN